MTSVSAVWLDVSLLICIFIHLFNHFSVSVRRSPTAHVLTGLHGRVRILVIRVVAVCSRLVWPSWPRHQVSLFYLRLWMSAPPHPSLRCVFHHIHFSAHFRISFLHSRLWTSVPPRPSLLRIFRRMYLSRLCPHLLTFACLGSSILALSAGRLRIFTRLGNLFFSLPADRIFIRLRSPILVLSVGHPRTSARLSLSVCFLSAARDTSTRMPRDTNRPTDEQRDKQTDKQTSRQTNIQTHTHTHTHTHAHTHTHTHAPQSSAKIIGASGPSGENAQTFPQRIDINNQHKH